jgi:hypothetical protein
MCESTLLGLKGCNATEPTTGLYLDDLGISQSLLGQFITDQYQNGVELFEAKRSFAWKQLQSKMMTAIATHIKPNTIIEGKRVGQFNSNPAVAVTAKGAGQWVGIRLKITPQSTSFLELYLDNIIIHGTASNIGVKVFDLYTKKLIDTFTVLSGGAEQFVQKNFKSARRATEIAIVYESTFDTLRMIPKQGSCLDCGGNPKYSHMCPFVDALGVVLTISADTVQTITSTPYTWGMSLNYNVNCDRNAWLCSIGASLSMSLAYLTAVEIYNYALTVSPSQRSNTAISINRGEKPFATANAVEGIVAARDIAAERFGEEFNAVLQHIQLPSDTYCFDCRRTSKYVTALP